MKKYLNLSLVYAVAAMVGGVFYREFTKFSGFDGVTALGKVHTHLFLLVALFAAQGTSRSRRPSASSCASTMSACR